MQSVALVGHSFTAEDKHAARGHISPLDDIIQVDILRQIATGIFHATRSETIKRAVLTLKLLRHGNKRLRCRDSGGEGLGR